MAKRGEKIHKRKDGRWEGRCIKRRTTDEKPIWSYLYGYAYGIVKDYLMKRKVLSRALHNYWDGLGDTVWFRSLLTNEMIFSYYWL